MKSIPSPFAEPINESFDAIASKTGFPFLKCDFTAIVTVVSVMLMASLFAVFDVHGATIKRSVKSLGPIGSALSIVSIAGLPHIFSIV